MDLIKRIGICLITLTLIVIGETTNTEPLIFSNYPENIEYPQKVFSEEINIDNIRFHYYHKNKTKQPFSKSLTITNQNNSTANIQIINISNTQYDGSKASFYNSYLYWKSLLNHQENSIQIKPNSSILISEEKVLSSQINHGILKIKNPQKNNLLVELTYKDSIYEKIPVNQIKPIIFDTMVKKEMIILPAGPKIIIPIGKNDKTKYTYNHGNYGQIHEIILKFINPYDYPLESKLYYHRVSGMSRNNIIINDKIYQTKYILLDSPIETIHTFKIPSNSTPTHKISLFPESGNFYPIEIVISSLMKPVIHH